jgi:replicative DNA helicase
MSQAINEIVTDIDEKIKQLMELKSMALEEDSKLETLAEVRKRVKSKGKVIKYETGVKAIDNQMGGFSEGSFINIAGENFSGKTTFVLKIIQNIARHNRAVFFSFEMYETLLVNNKLKDTKIDNNLIVVQNRYTLTEIDTIIRTEADKGVKFFAIDSMMKIKGNVKLKDHQKASEISNTLSKLTQELGVIILLINQMSLIDIREKRLEFKGSGDISYDSDVSFFITVDDKERRTLHCKKDRINERLWQEDITDRSYQIKPVVTTFKTDSYEYKGSKVEMPDF